MQTVSLYTTKYIKSYSDCWQNYIHSYNNPYINKFIYFHTTILKYLPFKEMKNLYFIIIFFQSCAQKVAVLNPANNQIISLSTLYTWSGCKEVTENGVTKVKCVGGRTFRSSRERWWFIAISRCDPGTTVSTNTG